MTSVNQELFDSQTLHNVRIEFLKNGIVKRMLDLLASSDAELSARLRVAIEDLQGSQFNVQRIEAILASVYEINRAVYSDFRESLNTELEQFAEYEATWQQDNLEKILPTGISFERVAIPQVYAAAVARPFQSRLLSEWYETIEESAKVRIRDAVRLGVIQSETTGQIVKRIRGTRANAYKDGLIEISRKDAQTIVLTAVAHTQDVAKNAVYQANADLIDYEMWNATLDTRVCPQCAELDGKRFELGKGPRPPLHMRDRCVRIPVLKSWRDLGFDVDELPPSTRASMDGQVPADMTYSAWLKKQSASIQDEVLGKERGRLYRQSGENLNKFINREGKFYTLEQLRTIEN